MATTLLGPVEWSASVDDDGHREYKIVYKVRASSTSVGPAQVQLTSGLPKAGAYWNVDGDVDFFAWCMPTRTVKPFAREKDKPHRYWLVECTFSTKAPKRCQQDKVDDPLLEPVKVSGGYYTVTEEKTTDKDGKPLINTAFENLRGPQVEFEESRPTVTIEKNYVRLDFSLLDSLVNRVNDAPLWGRNPRSILFKHYSWERKYHGLCHAYYTLKMEFEINPNTYDRSVLDEATKCLNGQWTTTTSAWQRKAVGGGTLNPTAAGVLLDGALNPDPDNPSHFIKSVDRSGNPHKVILNGRGVPFDPTPQEKRTGCTSCTDGASRYWDVVSGFEDDEDRFYMDIQLDHTANCHWEVSIGGETFTLDLVENRLQLLPLAAANVNRDRSAWVFTSNQLGGTTWELANTDWDCLGPNIMRKAAGGDPNQAESITIQPRITETPGFVDVKYYEEGNFLRLGIPTIL